jgi:predicted DNA-binding transcriptional regulator YafY
MSLLERIYYFHSRILDNRYPNSGDLVREFEISPATAHRDIAYLRDRLLAPLVFSQRQKGYYYTDSEFRLPYEDTPRLVMLLGVLQKIAGETGLFDLPELKKLQQKLTQLLDQDNRTIDNLIHCEWVETEPVDTAIFADVLGVLLNGRQLRITYTSAAGKSSKRSIDPLKLVNYQGRWYILAWCHLRRSRRMFHLSRIKKSQRLETRAEHRLKTDDEWLSGSFGIFKGDANTRFRAKILLTGTAAEIVRHQRWHPDQEITMTGNGLILNLPVSDDRELIMKVLQFGSQASIIGPDELRKKVRDEIEKMADLYKND